MSELSWLAAYSGESVDELIALASSHRIDSIVLAFEQALQERAAQIGLGQLHEAEVTVLAVEALEREVNNGGYHQFFFNTPEFAPLIVEALERIACPDTSRISADAISLIGLCHPFTAEQVQQALENDPEGNLIEILYDRCDKPYYDSAEPIAERLFEYLCKNRASIRLR